MACVHVLVGMRCRRCLLCHKRQHIKHLQWFPFPKLKRGADLYELIAAALFSAPWQLHLLIKCQQYTSDTDQPLQRPLVSGTQLHRSCCSLDLAVSLLLSTQVDLQPLSRSVAVAAPALATVAAPCPTCNSQFYLPFTTQA